MNPSYIANIIPHLQVWWQTILIVVYLIGLILAFASLFQAVSQKYKYKKTIPLWTFYSSVFLLNIPALLDTISMTVLNQSSEQSLSYVPPANPGQIYIQFSVYVIMIIGLIGVAKGAFLLSRRDENVFGKAIIYMGGGTCAVNIIKVLKGLGYTVGGDVNSYITNIIG